MRSTLLMLLLCACQTPASPLASAAMAPGTQVVRITAKRFEYTPSRIVLKRGVPVVLELVSLDRKHGFKVPGLKLRAEIVPGTPTRLNVTPSEAGTFPVACDVFCGSGHEDMTGEVVVEP
jgi:cytochrome c oxidase subunit II